MFEPNPGHRRERKTLFNLSSFKSIIVSPAAKDSTEPIKNCPDWPGLECCCCGYCCSMKIFDKCQQHHLLINIPDHTNRTRTRRRYIMSSSSMVSIFIQMFTYLGIASLLLSSLESVQAVRINTISRPQSYLYGTANSIILDCDFSLDDGDDRLTVKWFLNDETHHIYQWIPSRDSRTYSDKIRPYVDENFIIKDYQTRHRALRLLNPPPSLSGKYTCSVSSLQNEDINSTYLVIYEPARSFEMAAIEDEDGDDGFNITCTAYGLYPEPEIKLYKVRSINETLVSEEVQSNTTSVISFLSMTNGFYSITLISHIEQNQTMHNGGDDDDDENDPDHSMSPARARLLASNRHQQQQQRQPSRSKAANNIAEHYECRLSIPNTDYVEVKRLAIQDGWRTKWRTNGATGIGDAIISGYYGIPSVTILSVLLLLLVGRIE